MPVSELGAFGFRHRDEVRGARERRIVVQPRVAVVRREDAASVAGVRDEVLLIRGQLVHRHPDAGQDHHVVEAERLRTAVQVLRGRRARPEVRAVVHVELHAPVAARLRELRLVDPHLHEHALGLIGLARGDGDERNVALRRVARHARQVRRERRAGAGSDAGDGDLAPPAPELDDERDVGADGDVDQRERPVRTRLRRDERIARDLAAALAALHAGREGRHGGVGHVDDRVVDGIGGSVLRKSACDDGAGDAGRPAFAWHLLQAEVRAGQRVAALTVDARAAAGVRVLADAALQDPAAPVGGRAAVDAEVDARLGRAERAPVGAEAVAAAALAEAAVAAGLRHGTAAALEQIAAAVAVGPAVVAERGAGPWGTAREHPVDGAVPDGAVGGRIEGLEREQPSAAPTAVDQHGDHDGAGAQAEGFDSRGAVGPRAWAQCSEGCALVAGLKHGS